MRYDAQVFTIGDCGPGRHGKPCRLPSFHPAGTARTEAGPPGWRDDLRVVRLYAGYSCGKRGIALRSYLTAANEPTLLPPTVRTKDQGRTLTYHRGHSSLMSSQVPVVPSGPTLKYDPLEVTA
jgi:hypothetical protein